MWRLANSSAFSGHHFAAACWQSFSGTAHLNWGCHSCICPNRDRRHMKKGGKLSFAWKAVPNNTNTKTGPVVLPLTVDSNELKDWDRLRVMLF